MYTIIKLVEILSSEELSATRIIVIVLRIDKQSMCCKLKKNIISYECDQLSLENFILYVY